MIKIKWPKWFQDNTMMSDVDVSVDEQGNMTNNYPEHHQVYNIMGLTSRKLEDDDGHIYSKGLFCFQHRMDITKYNPECFKIEVDNQKKTATIFQILFMELVDDKPFVSPIVKKKGGGLKFSKSPASAGTNKWNVETVTDEQSPVGNDKRIKEAN